MTRRFTPAGTPPHIAEQLEAVFMHAPSGVALVAADGTFLRVNPALERMLGRPADELLQLRWQDLVNPRDVRAGQAAGLGATSGESFDEVFRVRHADGRELVLRVSGNAVATQEGDAPAFAVHYEDLTEQLAEARRTQVLAAVAAGVSDAVVVIDHEGRIVFVNEAAERLYGAEHEALTGRDAGEALLHADAAGETAPWTPGEHVVETHRKADGSRFLAEVSPSAVRAPDGTRVATAGVIRDVTARLEELEGAAFMRTVVDSAAEGIIGLDERNEIRIFSPAAERIYGWTADEVIGKPGAMLAPEHLEDRVRNLREGLRAGRTVQRESEALRKDGTVAPIMLTASPFHDADGEYRGTAITVLDLSERQRARREAQQTRVLLQHLIDYAPGMISVKDQDGRYMLINRQGAAMIGRDAADAIGRTDFDFYPEPDARESNDEDRRVIETGEPLIAARDIELPDGSVRPFLITKFAIPGSEPGEAHVGVVATDVTDLRRGQADRARLEALVRAAPDAIVTSDLDGVIRSWNPGAEAIFGLRAEEAVGQPIAILVPEHEREHARELRERVHAGEMLTVRIAALRADGTIFPAEASAAPLVGIEGTHLGLVALVRDISELMEKELELRDRAAQLERSNTDLERFAYAASHDLQEPLRSIRLSADVLVRSAKERLDEDERALLDHVEAAAERAGAQVSALLRLARVALGREPQEPVPLDLALEDAVNALRAAIRESGAQVDAPAPLPSATMPRAELALLLQNLIANAIKFRRPDVPPRITISGTVQDDCVELRVEDNGIGLSADDRAQVFGIFGRGRQDVPGTGMGLAVCQRMVRRRGGSIAALSEGPGKGSVFVLRLPAA
jgi:PAS domain S-box-containing protein